MQYPAIGLALLVFSTGASAQHLIVTAEGPHGRAPSEVVKDEVSVEVDRRPGQVKEWVPLRGDEAALEFYFVIDDGEDSDLGNQFGSLKNFIHGQPGTTRIGLAYLRNGSANIAVPLTTDRAQLAKALRLPLGEPGIAASPYMGIADLVKKWPAADARREVLLISSGTDPWSPSDPENPYLRKAIADAQRAGIQVHSIYYPGSGHLGHNYSRISWGQNYLSELGDATGGEAYWQGFGSPVSIDDWLKDLAQRLQNQYLLTVEAPDTKGGLEPVRVNAATGGASLVAAHQIEMQPAID
jgi:hypothetical protein